jgi:putative membrane protein
MAAGSKFISHSVALLVNLILDSTAGRRGALGVVRREFASPMKTLSKSLAPGAKRKTALVRRSAMYYYFWGMHWFWWIFWVFLWIMFLSFMMPMRRTTYREMQSPLQLLKRRYAAGEITSEEYEERRAKLLRDANVK